MLQILKQHPQFARETIELHDRQVIIKFEFAGESQERAVWLRDLQPTARRVGRRFYRFTIGPIAAIAFSLWTTPVLLQQESVPRVFAAFPIALGIYGLWYLWKGLHSTPTFQFLDISGAVAFEIYAPTEKFNACMDFVSSVERKLAERMEAAEPGATDNPGDAQRLREDH